MKLFRWALAGTSIYVIYRYSIGKNAKGEAVFSSPERTPADPGADGAVPERAIPVRTARVKPRAAKQPGK